MWSDERWKVARPPVWRVQNTPTSDHFWKLRCRKSARRCGAKHMSKSKVLRTDGIAPLLEVEMSKKRTPLWREARSQVIMYKAHQPDHFWKLRCRKSARCCGAKMRKAHVEVKSGKQWWFRSTFGRSDVALCGGHKGFCTLPKSAQNVRVAVSTTTTTLHSTTTTATTSTATTLH